MIRLTDDYMKGQLARSVPGAYYSPEEKAWVLDEATPRAAMVALKLFPTLGHQYPEVLRAREELSQDVRPFDMATEWVGETFYRTPAPRVRAIVAQQRDHNGDTWHLHGYQETDLAYAEAVLRSHGAFYLGWERGLGKTLGTCVLLDSLDTRRNLIVAPNTAKDTVWASELRRFCPWLEVIVLGNTPAARRHALARVEELDAELRPFALVIHYEALALLAGKERYEDAKGKGKTRIGNGWKRLGLWDMVVTDEDHRLANPGTQAFRAIKKVPRTMLLVLSGSIIQNHLEELFSPHSRAFPDKYKAKWRDWNDRYLDYAEGGYGKVLIGVKEDQVEAMRQELGVWMVYRRKEDELDLPPKTYDERRVQLSPTQRKVYDQLAEECLAQLADGTMVKAMAGAAMLTRLRQVATGLDLLGGVADSTKLDVATDIVLDGEDDEFVIFSWYKAAVQAMADRLKAKGVESFTVTGDTPHKVRADYIERFRAGEGRVFIGTLATLGESVNLQRANNVIRLDRSFNPMLNVQAEDRVFRQGQTRNVTITDLIAADTVDELLVEPNLANKLAIRAAILGG